MEELLTSLAKALSEINWSGMFDMLKEATAKIQESGIFEKIIAAITELMNGTVTI